jgi:hypothetical protein
MSNIPKDEVRRRIAAATLPPKPAPIPPLPPTPLPPWPAVKAALRRGWRLVTRSIRTGRILATDRGLPLWLRILLVIGCIQIPVLPFDEIALVLAVAIMAVFYRATLRLAWQRAA